MGGIIDGEGTFATNGERIKSPTFCVMMVCEETMDRFCAILDKLFDVSYSRSVTNRKNLNHTPCHVVRIRTVRSLMLFCMQLQPFVFTKQAQLRTVYIWTTLKTNWARGQGRNHEFHERLKFENRRFQRAHHERSVAERGCAPRE